MPPRRKPLLNSNPDRRDNENDIVAHLGFVLFPQFKSGVSNRPGFRILKTRSWRMSVRIFVKSPSIFLAGKKQPILGLRLKSLNVTLTRHDLWRRTRRPHLRNL
jgi:hypothetical protein